MIGSLCHLIERLAVLRILNLTALGKFLGDPSVLVLLEEGIPQKYLTQNVLEVT